jgi:hypothetical protein
MKKAQKYSEAQLVQLFGLNRLNGNAAHPTMHEWTDTSTVLNDGEKYLFDIISKNLSNKIIGWNEEMLKMNFISPLLILGHFIETDRYKTYYESPLEGEVQGHKLKIRADMMVASGVLERPKVPYFYFQEYKKQKDPTGDVTAQVLEAFLIAQSKNNNNKPMYGCEVVGKQWSFVIMQNQTYCISKSYDCTEHDDLMKIIAILRKFKYILETRLLD